MTIAVMQPYIFPYLGYFQLINSVDTFVFYDDVNFIKKGWIHRNNILVNNNAHLFTIPCKGISQNKLINEIEHDFNVKEQTKFLKKIEMAYKKAPQFSEVFSFLNDFVENQKDTKISELAKESVLAVCHYLNLKRNFLLSSQHFSESRGLEKQERLVRICQLENAEQYHNPIGGKTIYSKDDFLQSDIDLQFVESEEVQYPQFKESFVPYLSILDVLMFNDKTTTNKLLASYKLI